MRSADGGVRAAGFALSLVWMALHRWFAAPAVIALVTGAGVLLPAAQPVSATALRQISAGYEGSCALDNGKAYCRGRDTGEFGSDGGVSHVPVAVDTSGVPR